MDFFDPARLSQFKFHTFLEDHPWVLDVAKTYNNAVVFAIKSTAIMLRDISAIDSFDAVIAFVASNPWWIALFVTMSSVVAVNTILLSQCMLTRMRQRHKRKFKLLVANYKPQDDDDPVRKEMTKDGSISMDAHCSLSAKIGELRELLSKQLNVDITRVSFFETNDSAALGDEVRLGDVKVVDDCLHCFVKETAAALPQDGSSTDDESDEPEPQEDEAAAPSGGVKSLVAKFDASPAKKEPQIPRSVMRSVPTPFVPRNRIVRSPGPVSLNDRIAHQRRKSNGETTKGGWCAAVDNVDLTKEEQEQLNESLQHAALERPVGPQKRKRRNKPNQQPTQPAVVSETEDVADDASDEEELVEPENESEVAGEFEVMKSWQVKRMTIAALQSWLTDHGVDVDPDAKHLKKHWVDQVLARQQE